MQNRLIVEGYLAHKWGLESSLPTGHPYNAPSSLRRDQPDFGDPFHDAADAALNYMIDWGPLDRHDAEPVSRRMGGSESGERLTRTL